MPKSVMTSRLAAELDHAFERNGWSAQEVKRLSSGNLLAEVLKVVLGLSVIKPDERIIDCDVAPYVPDGWTVEEHLKGGQFKFKELLVLLFLTDDQSRGKSPEFCKVRDDLSKELLEGVPLNANVLDHLLTHQELIPKHWKGKFVFFWGTTFRDRFGRLCVRCLEKHEYRWEATYNYDSSNCFGSNMPAAMRIG